MSELSLFYFLQKKIFKNHIHTLRQQSVFKIVVVSLFAIAFWAALFVMFYRGLRFFELHIQQIHRDFFDFMLEYLFSLLYFSLFLMLTFSSTIIAFSVFFHEQETSYLMTCPLPFTHIFFYKLVETFMFASWAVLFLGLPLCCAYGIQRGVSFVFYPVLLLLYIPFIALPAIIGALITFLIILYLLRFRRVLAYLFLGLLLIGVMLLGISIARLKDELPAYTAAWFFGILDYLNFAKHPLLPSTWMTKAMISLAQQDYRECFFQFMLLLSTTLFLGCIGHILSANKYDRAWSIIHSTDSGKSFWRLRWLPGLANLLFFLKPQNRLFLEKDIRIFVRDVLQWSQFGILLGLLLIYILNLRTLRYDQQAVFWKHVIATLNLTATALTLCTFASRFIFPLLSLEGKRLWLLGVMPIKRSGILLAKFILASVVLLITSEILVILSCYMLRLPWLLASVHAITILGITVGVAGLSVGLGAIYPTFHEDSPAKIVSGFGGTLNLVLSLVFVLVMVVIQFVPSTLAIRGSMSIHFSYFWILLGILSVCITSIVPLYMGIRCFDRLEM
jgi:ABC-2 type transport system permease protein